MKKKVLKNVKKPAKIEVKRRPSPIAKKIVEHQTSILDDAEDDEDDLEEVVNDDTQEDDEEVEEMDENNLPDVPENDDEDESTEEGEEGKTRAKFNYHVTFYTEEGGFEYREFIKKSELGKFIASLESSPYKIIKGRLIEPKKRVVVTFG